MEGYRVTDRVSPKLWDAFVASRPEATSYHRHAWGRVIAGSFGHTTHYLAAVDSAGALQGVLPLTHMKSGLFGNFLVSLPFFNYGGLLCGDEIAQRALLAAAERLRRSCGAGHVELRHLAVNVKGLRTQEHKVTMVLPLAADAQSQWSAFNAKLRNQVRKAEKSGLGCAVGHLELLDDFYAIFARNMRDLGTPVYAKGFFANVLAAFPGSTRIFVVRSGEKTIAAGIGCWFRQSMEMPWASSIADYKSLCPNNMLYWEAIRFAIERGFTSFDFGRSTPNEGTYNFKKQWGAVPVQLYWQYLLEPGGSIPAINNKNPRYQLAIKAWKRLPVGLTRLIGPHLVCKIP